MAKCIYTDNVKKILKNIASNGNVIAKLILEELEADNEMASKSACNYFDFEISTCDSSRYFTITACLKDLNNPNFPDKGADPWDPKYRSEIGVQQFISRFASIRKGVKVDKTIPEIEIQNFTDLFTLPTLTICVGDSYDDFLRAYDGDNYVRYHSENTLHNSCMRHRDRARDSADFYANCAKTKIVYVKDKSNKIYGRAILWEGMTLNDKEVTFIDRIYYSDRAVMTLITDFALKNGWYKKVLNTYDSKDQFLAPIDGKYEQMPSSVAYWKLSDSEDYQRGCPYLDTLSYVVVKDQNFYLTNKIDDSFIIMSCTSTNGAADRHRNHHFCPICGTVHTGSTDVCSSCINHFDMYGSILIPKSMVTYKGKSIPVEFLDKDGNIKGTIINYNIINKMANNNR